jgi:ComF family protein
MTTGTFCDGFARIGEYDGLIRSLICQYKFARRQYLDKQLGALLATAVQIQPWTCELDGLVPVPISWRPRLRYGFSPPHSLAQQIGASLALPVLPMLYERGKRHSQVGLSLADRPGNVRGVFRLHRAARPAGGIFCIVDDVSTTGATVQEAARVLKKAGATRVYAAVLAKTNPDRAHSLRA